MLIPVIEPLKEKLSILTLLGVYSSEKLRPPGASSRFLWGTGSWCGRRVRQSVRVPRRGAACSAGHRHTPGSRDAAGWSHGRTPMHAVPRAHPSVGRMPPAPAPGPCRRRGSDPGSAGGAGAAGLLSSARGHAWHTVRSPRQPGTTQQDGTHPPHPQMQVATKDRPGGQADSPQLLHGPPAHQEKPGLTPNPIHLLLRYLTAT